MIARFVLRVAVRFAAWGQRRGIPWGVLEESVERSFSHHSPEWRAQFLDRVRQRNRDRLMREINA